MLKGEVGVGDDVARTLRAGGAAIADLQRAVVDRGDSVVGCLICGQDERAGAFLDDIAVADQAVDDRGTRSAGGNGTAASAQIDRAVEIERLVSGGAEGVGQGDLRRDRCRRAAGGPDNAYGPADLDVQNMYYTSATGFPENDGLTGWDNPNNYGSGAGRLIKKKYLSSPSRAILTCPALGQKITLNDSGNPNSSYRAGYYYNPHPALDVTKSEGAPAATGYWTTRYKKIRQIPKDRCLAIDFFYDRSTLGHFDSKTNTWYINVVYSDGHAVSVPNKFAFDRMMGAGGTLGWKWERVMDVIGTTELLGAGESIDGKSGGFTMLTDKFGNGSGNPNAFYDVYPEVPHN